MTADTYDARFDDAFACQLTELFRLRRDVRHFRSDPLPAGMVEQLLDIACLAPSVGLSQPWRFVIVESSERRVQVREIFRKCNAAARDAYAERRAVEYAALKLAGLDQAPCQIAVFSKNDPAAGHGLGRQSMPETVQYSVVMAIHTLWLAARTKGIGLGWVSILDPKQVHVALDVPEDWLFIGYLCIGYPSEQHETPELERRGWELRRSSKSFVVQR